MKVTEAKSGSCLWLDEIAPDDRYGPCLAYLNTLDVWTISSASVLLFDRPEVIEFLKDWIGG